MGEKYIDLHIHTKCSDGELTAEQVIARAQEAGTSCISLTDHNVFTIYEPLHAAGLTVLPGAEFSTMYVYDAGKKREIHLLGIFPQGVDRKLDEIWECVEKDPWIEAMLELLESLGIHITVEELQRRNPESKRMNRSQVAKMLVEKGYAKDRDDAMDRFIGNRSPYYINPADYVNYIPLNDCVHKILQYGGIPILAHPLHYGFTREQVEELFAYYAGLADSPLGVEVYYGKYNEEEVQWLKELADQYGLLPSAGSDFHKASHTFVRGREELLCEMKKSICRKSD